MHQLYLNEHHLLHIFKLSDNPTEDSLKMGFASKLRFKLYNYLYIWSILGIIVWLLRGIEGKGKKYQIIWFVFNSSKESGINPILGKDRFQLQYRKMYCCLASLHSRNSEYGPIFFVIAWIYLNLEREAAKKLYFFSGRITKKEGGGGGRTTKEKELVWSLFFPNQL